MPAKKPAPKKTSSVNDPPASFFGRLKQKTVVPARRRIGEFIGRRPHRSLKMTRRRDYVRSLKLPGYWALTNDARKTLWQYRKPFALLMATYAILTVALIGIASQDTYTQLSGVLRQTSGDVFKGNWGELGKAGLLLVSGATGQYNVALTETQQVYAVIVVLFTWLTSVWLLRALIAGKKPKLRDALYNAGAPILPTFLIFLLLIVQLLPVVVAVLGFTALLPFGIVDGGAEAMLFWIAAGLLVLLSLYWITGTLIALVVVTLPGMYPMKAIRAAGDLVVGRRLRVMFRIVWLLIVTALLWAAVMMPVILIDAWLKGVFPAISWLPVIPIMLLVMGTMTVVWMSGYIYLLYRRIVDDNAAPA
jgi:hypothetical protein